MSLTESHRKRVTQKIQDNHVHGSVTEVRHSQHQNEFEKSVQNWVTVSVGRTGYTRQLAVCLDREELNDAFEATIARLKESIISSACYSSVGYCSVHQGLFSRPLRSQECSYLTQGSYDNRYTIRPFIYQAPESKSVFDMSAAEFKNHVRPRAVELANDRWNKGLSLSTPAGEGYAPNQFFHIYKDKSVQLVEVQEETGEVKFIKQIS